MTTAPVSMTGRPPLSSSLGALGILSLSSPSPAQSQSQSFGMTNNPMTNQSNRSLSADSTKKKSSSSPPFTSALTSVLSQTQTQAQDQQVDLTNSAANIGYGQEELKTKDLNGTKRTLIVSNKVLMI
jgi:hypothetical protein